MKSRIFFPLEGWVLYTRTKLQTLIITCQLGSSQVVGGKHVPLTTILCTLFFSLFVLSATFRNWEGPWFSAGKWIMFSVTPWILAQNVIQCGVFSSLFFFFSFPKVKKAVLSMLIYLFLIVQLSYFHMLWYSIKQQKCLLFVLHANLKSN